MRKTVGWILTIVGVAGLYFLTYGYLAAFVFHANDESGHPIQLNGVFATNVTGIILILMIISGLLVYLGVMRLRGK